MSPTLAVGGTSSNAYSDTCFDAVCRERNDLKQNIVESDPQITGLPCSIEAKLRSRYNIAEAAWEE